MITNLVYYYAQVSWCKMDKSNDGRGARWVMEKPVLPIVKGKKKVCSYVEEALLSAGWL